MRIALLNGSPKVKSSASGSLLGSLKSYVLAGDSTLEDVVEIGLHKGVLPEKALEQLENADVLVFACPLYVDGIPAHLLSCLVQLEKTHWKKEALHVYGVVNCGFYEGIQAEFALDILRNWCVKSGVTWGGGIGVGGGGGLAQMPDVKGGHGPKAPVEHALKGMAEKILKKEKQENVYVSVAFPRRLYKMAAQMGWRQMIKANGGKAADLGKRPQCNKT